jgi:AraC-like DNA-binding protein
MARRNKSCSACLQLQQRVEDQATHEPATLECFAGLSESAVAVRAGQTVVGFLQTGQVFLRTPTRKDFKRIMQEVGQAGPESPACDLEEVYFQTRVLAPRQYEMIIRLLTIFAQHLGALGNQLLIQHTSAEPPAITKVRSYIAENLSEELHLNEVARSANMSSFYFCKLFKRTTGLTFTTYLARLRIEVVKQNLLNSHTRVSEAAYATGFQSLSQFNRVFRHVVGESPTDYRDRLHGFSQPRLSPLV